MGQSAEELRRDIATTRADLGETLDAIGDRVSPGRVIERRKNRISHGFRSAKERVMGTTSHMGHSVSDQVGGTAGGAVEVVKGAPDTAMRQTQGNPLAAGAVAFGVGFLVAAAFPPSRKEEEATEQLMERAEPVKQQLVESGKEVADHLKGSAQEAAEQVKQSATDSGQQVASTAKDAAQQGKSAVQGAAATTKDQASSS